MCKNIFEVITEYAVNEGLNSVMRQSDEYRQIHGRIDELTKEFDGLGLPKEQRLVVDRLLSSYNESGAFYGRMTYQQGFRDCVSLLVEIGMTRMGRESDGRCQERQLTQNT